MEKKIVFFDLDGTVSDIIDGVRPSVVEAIARVRKAGHVPFICTGRTRAFIPEEVLRMDFVGMVGAMGAYLEYQGQCIQNIEVTTTQARKALDVLRAHGMIPVMEGREYMYYDKDEYTNEVDWFATVITEQIGNRWRPIKGYENVMHINKISAKKQPGCTAEAACTEMADFFQPVFHEGGLGGTTVEMGPTGITKGTGMKKILELTGNTGCPVIAFGDSNNDLGMFEAADYKVAMGNATESLKKQADYITGTQEEEGILTGLEQLGLI
ncbi:MAG: HAD family hydrolase [Lachnospiraceae bacterium]|nr:HAD family hydrolase [Lachnospiraceae bacterium]